MPVVKLCIFLCSVSIALFAHDTIVDTSVQFLNFSHSIQKKEGKKYTLHLRHNRGSEHYHIAYEKSDTDTFQPPLPHDLEVDKLYLHYAHSFSSGQSLHMHYAVIEDNLAKETDGGKIYGVGYRYRHFHFTQYLSDYRHFDVYQSDLLYKIYRKFSRGDLRMVFVAKYIHLVDKKSNNFSKNAKSDYFTPGINLHLQKSGFFGEVGAYFGKRVFAVMQNGFAVQHHAMEFTKSYMVGIGKVFKRYTIQLQYNYLKANELPLNNENVTVGNLTLRFVYRL